MDSVFSEGIDLEEGHVVLDEHVVQLHDDVGSDLNFVGFDAEAMGHGEGLLHAQPREDVHRLLEDHLRVLLGHILNVHPSHWGCHQHRSLHNSSKPTPWNHWRKKNQTHEKTSLTPPFMPFLHDPFPLPPVRTCAFTTKSVQPDSFCNRKAPSLHLWTDYCQGCCQGHDLDLTEEKISKRKEEIRDVLNRERNEKVRKVQDCVKGRQVGREVRQTWSCAMDWHRVGLTSAHGGIGTECLQGRRSGILKLASSASPSHAKLSAEEGRTRAGAAEVSLNQENDVLEAFAAESKVLSMIPEDDLHFLLIIHTSLAPVLSHLWNEELVATCRDVFPTIPSPLYLKLIRDRSLCDRLGDFLLCLPHDAGLKVERDLGPSLSRVEDVSAKIAVEAQFLRFHAHSLQRGRTDSTEPLASLLESWRNLVGQKRNVGLLRGILVFQLTKLICQSLELFFIGKFPHHPSEERPLHDKEDDLWTYRDRFYLTQRGFLQTNSVPEETQTTLSQAMLSLVSSVIIATLKQVTMNHWLEWGEVELKDLPWENLQSGICHYMHKTLHFLLNVPVIKSSFPPQDLKCLVSMYGNFVNVKEVQSMSVEELMGMISPRSFISSEALHALVRHEQLLSETEACRFLQGCGELISLEGLGTLLQRCRNQDADELKHLSLRLMMGFPGEDQRRILEEFVSRHGLETGLETKAFPLNLTKALNQMSAQVDMKSELVHFTLALQNPEKVISALLAQTLKTGMQLKILGQVLQDLRCVCSHESDRIAIPNLSGSDIVVEKTLLDSHVFELGQTLKPSEGKSFLDLNSLLLGEELVSVRQILFCICLPLLDLRLHDDLAVQLMQQTLSSAGSNDLDGIDVPVLVCHLAQVLEAHRDFSTTQDLDIAETIIECFTILLESPAQLTEEQQETVRKMLVSQAPGSLPYIGKWVFHEKDTSSLDPLMQLWCCPNKEPSHHLESSYLAVEASGETWTSLGNFTKVAKQILQLAQILPTVPSEYQEKFILFSLQDLGSQKSKVKRRDQELGQLLQSCHALKKMGVQVKTQLHQIH
ncbi:unnamed protein product [Darwinula stevensoni]|uniref:Uncharacterized protein n=1 Tax=Darwinula stevensoni TaxID=69355 RepID=A0A7R9A4F8_9CRUS|nr:unnamed protein product [Darwinula stevensoni]CAG0893526.1 unnamed protein product [Darwinula stevensoni]